jgi:hypothetical protein
MGQKINLNQQIDKKIKSYASTALFGGILQIIFGFGFGFVNLAIFVITLLTAIIALVKNKGRIKKITYFSCIGIGLVILAIILCCVVRLPAPIDYLLQAILR